MYSQILRRLLFLIILLVLGLPALTRAATLNVPSQYKTIQSAVNATHNGDTVLVADGTYTGDGNRDIDFDGKSIAVISQNGPTKTIINCGGYESTDGSGNHRGFYIHSGETAAKISGFTVENGYEIPSYGSVTDASVDGNGGGIFIYNSNVTIQNCTINGNTAQNNGGGVYNENGGSTIALTNCTISGNYAQYGNFPGQSGGFSGGGGGVYNDGNGGTITLTNCNITGNTVHSSDGGGGGVYNNGSYSVGAIMLKGCTITTNTAYNDETTDSGGGGGGGIYNSNGDGNGNGDTITVINCTVTGNEVSGASSSGGGMLNDNSCGGTITVTNCTVARNTNQTNDSYGGGIYNGNGNDYQSIFSDTITFTDCVIADNKGTHGGGMCNASDVGGTITLSNCSITGNTASDSGGALNDDGGGTITLTSCRITGNSNQIGAGGGIRNNGGSGEIVLTSCLVTENTAQNGNGGGIYNLNFQGGRITLNDCTISENTAAGVTSSFAADGAGSGGGVFNENEGALYDAVITLANCTVTNNKASEGGGIYNLNSDSYGNTMITLTNCVISSNTAIAGGGIANEYDLGINIIALTNCTVTKNTAQLGIGGGISGSEISLTNDIIYGDSGSEVAGADNSSPKAIVNYCDIQGGYPTVQGAPPSMGIINADPLFVNASAGDLHLASGSPCLGAGTSVGAPATDKDGMKRPDPPSMGAYEYAGPAAITSFTLSPGQIDAPGLSVIADVATVGGFSRVTVSPAPRSLAHIASPMFTLTSSGPHWVGLLPTAYLKYAQVDPIKFIATGIRTDGTTVTADAYLTIGSTQPQLSIDFSPDKKTLVAQGDTITFSGTLINNTSEVASAAKLQITLPDYVDYVPGSVTGVTYNPFTNSLVAFLSIPASSGPPSTYSFSFSVKVRGNAPVAAILTFTASASCMGFEDVDTSYPVQVVQGIPKDIQIKPDDTGLLDGTRQLHLEEGVPPLDATVMPVPTIGEDKDRAAVWLGVIDVTSTAGVAYESEANSIGGLLADFGLISPSVSPAYDAKFPKIGDSLTIHVGFTFSSCTATFLDDILIGLSIYFHTPILTTDAVVEFLDTMNHTVALRKVYDDLTNSKKPFWSRTAKAVTDLTYNMDDATVEVVGDIINAKFGKKLSGIEVKDLLEDLLPISKFVQQFRSLVTIFDKEKSFPPDLAVTFTAVPSSSQSPNLALPFTMSPVSP